MRNRWLIALAAIGLHISIGSVYAWSVLTRPIMTDMGFTMSQTTWTFSLAILMLGLSAGFLGSFAEKIGPKKSGLLSMLFWVAGLLGTAYALSIHNLTLLYLFYGIIGGIGLGIGYITPVSTLVKNFPNRPGFATGLAIMGFGFASLIAGPLMQFLVAQVGLVNNFIILGVIYLVVMGASSHYLKAPQPKQPLRTTKDKSTMYVHNHGMLANDAMKTWQFGALWWIFFINITCGIGLLSLASPMAQETIGMTPAAAASLVGIIGIFNGGGRIAWSTISDYFGRAQTYILFFIIQIIAFYVLAETNSNIPSFNSSHYHLLWRRIRLYASISCGPLWHTPTLHYSWPHSNRLGISWYSWSYARVILSRSRIWLYYSLSMLCSSICIKYNYCYNLKNIRQTRSA